MIGPLLSLIFGNDKLSITLILHDTFSIETLIDQSGVGLSKGYTVTEGIDICHVAERRVLSRLKKV